MKLIYCKSCDSVVRLIMKKPRYCECWKCWWIYTDNLNASYFWSEAHPFWIDNYSFGVRLRENIDENMKYNMIHLLYNWCDMQWDFKAFSLLRNINWCWKTFKKVTKKYFLTLI